MATAELYLPCGCVALIDAEDAERVEGYVWRLGKPRPSARCPRGRDRYVTATLSAGGVPVKIKLHRLILNAPAGVPVDHRDGNRLDNRKANLRLADHAGNSRNRGPNDGRQLKGVSFHRQSGKWQARCAAGAMRRQVGLFGDPVEAALAYDRAAAELHGEFARLNFPRAAVQS